MGVGGPIKTGQVVVLCGEPVVGRRGDSAGSVLERDPDTPFYTPDFNRPAFGDNPLQDHGVRLTWQAAAKHKIAFSENAQRSCDCSASQCATVSPEATANTAMADMTRQAPWIPSSDASHVDAIRPRTGCSSMRGHRSGTSFKRTCRYRASTRKGLNITDVGRNITYGAIAAAAYSAIYSFDPRGIKEQSQP